MEFELVECVEREAKEAKEPVLLEKGAWVGCLPIEIKYLVSTLSPRYLLLLFIWEDRKMQNFVFFVTINAVKLQNGQNSFIIRSAYASDRSCDCAFFPRFCSSGFKTHTTTKGIFFSHFCLLKSMEKYLQMEHLKKENDLQTEGNVATSY